MEGQEKLKRDQSLVLMMSQEGKYKLGPGQITDGPELQMAMMTALIKSD